MDYFLYRKAWKKLPRTRIEYYDYNEKVITELLVNALIHRIYDIMGAENSWGSGFKNIKEKDILKRIGSDRKGYWNVIKK